jgi:phosphomevalonate kinase
MGEISGGSNTPKMVSKLLQWREENYSQCEDYWNRLDSLQAQLSDLFQQISLVEKNSEKYQKDLKECSKVVIADMDPALSELATFLVEMHSVYKVSCFK